MKFEYSYEQFPPKLNLETIIFFEEDRNFSNVREKNLYTYFVEKYYAEFSDIILLNALTIHYKVLKTIYFRSIGFENDTILNRHTSGIFKLWFNSYSVC